MSLKNNRDSEQQVQESLNKTKGATAKVASTINPLKNSIKDTIKKGVKENIKGKSAQKKLLKMNMGKMLTSAATTMISTAVILVVLGSVIVLALTNVISPNNWLSNEDDISQIQKQTKNIINDAYESKENQVYKYVTKYIYENYNIYITNDDIINNSIQIETSDKICDIKLNFTPDAESTVNRINAYANAVNGVLSQYGGDEIQAETESNASDVDEGEITDFISMSEDERKDWIENIKNDIDANGNEFETQKNDNYAHTLRARKDQIFFPETTTNKWNNEIDYQKHVLVGYEQKKVCDECEREYCIEYSFDMKKCITSKKEKCACTVINAICSKSHYEDDHNKPIYKDIVKGTITVPMNYDISFYKKDEINKLISKISEEIGISQEDAEYEIKNLIYNYYNNYFLAFGLEDNGNAGYIGMDPIFFENGIEGWDGDFTLDDYQIKKFDYLTYGSNGNQNIIWSHIHSRSGGESTQCVALTWGFVRDAYSESDVTPGDGQNIVGALVREKGYTLLNTPAPGAIFSSGPYGMAGCNPDESGCNPYGHTGVVLSVKNGMVTYIEANYDRNGSIRVKTISEQSMLNGVFSSPYIKFAIPSYMEQ